MIAIIRSLPRNATGWSRCVRVAIGRTLMQMVRQTIQPMPIVRHRSARAERRGPEVFTLRRSARRSSVASATIVAAGLLVVSHRASAQIIETYFPPLGRGAGGVENDPTQQRVLNEYEPLGIRYRSFLLDGDLSEAVGYNTNVDNLPGGRGSPVIESQGALSAISDWTQHQLHANLSVDDSRYPQRSIQDRTDWTAGVGGIYELGRDKLGVSYTHLSLVQTPTDLGAIVTNQPIPYQVDSLDASYTATTHTPFSFIPELGATQYHFSEPNGGLIGQSQDQSYRNRVILDETLTSRYEAAPGRTLLLVLQGTEIRYENRLSGLPGRDANGGSALVGVDLGSTEPFTVRALAGYQFRDYRSSAYGSLQSPIVEVEVGWLPTRLTNVSLAVRTGIEDSAIESIVGYTYTSAKLAVEHEYQRNIILGAYGEIQNASYPSTPLQLQGTALNQSQLDQTIYGVGCSAKLLINRHLRLDANYDFSSQNAVDTGRFPTHNILVALHLVF